MLEIYFILQRYIVRESKGAGGKLEGQNGTT